MLAQPIGIEAAADGLKVNGVLLGEMLVCGVGHQIGQLNQARAGGVQKHGHFGVIAGAPPLVAGVFELARNGLNGEFIAGLVKQDQAALAWLGRAKLLRSTQIGRASCRERV